MNLIIIISIKHVLYGFIAFLTIENLHFNLYKSYYFYIIDDCSELTKRWSCVNCSRKYKNKSHLGRHIKYECGISGMFICSICNKSFKHSHHLKVHLGLIHGVVT